ncbi:TniQ family protein [Pararhizobium sp. LjRoot255]
MGISARQLPVRLAPYPDEVLSSWIIRHAAFYAVPPLAMLQHCLPEVQSLRTSDLDITESQVVRIARMFSADPATGLRMTFSNIAQSSRRLIASEPRQLCCSCSPITNELQPVLRSRFLGWRITCPLCGNLLQNTDGVPAPLPSVDITIVPL